VVSFEFLFEVIDEGHIREGVLIDVNSRPHAPVDAEVLSTELQHLELDLTISTHSCL
jgi:hypothetical protein